MLLFSRLSRRSQGRRTPTPRLAASFRPRLELLEDRMLLSAAATPTPDASYGQLPLAFTVNAGQAASPINYVTQGSGYSIGLTAQQAQINLGQGNSSTAVELQLVGANASAQAVGQNELITKTNYLIGDSSKWLTNLANYGQVEYQNVYQGVDAVYSGNQGQLETTFLVHPGANASVLQMQVQGADGLSLDAQGNLVLHTSGGDISELAPVMYQDINGTRQAVSGHYVLEGNNNVGFQVGAYDPSQTLVIDPTLSYSTYLNGSGSTGVGVGIAVDSSGDAYMVGTTTGSQPGRLGSGTFVDKLNAAGSQLVYQTFLGSSYGSGIAVDAAGDAYVTGLASSNFPTTANALQPTAPSSGTAGFVSVLDPTGANLLYSSYLSGAHTSAGGPWIAGPTVAISSGGVAPGALDNIYVTGEAQAGLPTTASAFQSSLAPTAAVNAFFVEINPNLTGSASLLYGSYLGGASGSGLEGDAGTGIAVDSSGNAYIVGYTGSTSFPTTKGAFQTTSGGGIDAFVAKFNPSLSGSASLIYSTYLGGSGYDGYYPFTLGTPYAFAVVQEPGPAIAVDSAGNAYITGSTDSSNFPTTSGAYQTSFNFSNQAAAAFVTKLNSTGTGLVYSTFLGGTAGKGKSAPLNINGGSSIAVDGSGNAYVTGWTYSSKFPTVNPVQSMNGGDADAFVTTLNSTGSSLLFSTYLGGSGYDYGYGIALDSAGNTYVTGGTYSTNFPTVAALQTSASNSFVFKIDPPASDGIVSPAVTPSASSVAPSGGGGATSDGITQGQESNYQSVPSPADQFFTLIGNNLGSNPTLSVLSDLVSEWQSLESALLAPFDSLLCMEVGAMGVSKDTLMRDLLFGSMSALKG